LILQHVNKCIVHNVPCQRVCSENDQRCVFLYSPVSYSDMVSNELGVVVNT